MMLDADPASGASREEEPCALGAGTHAAGVKKLFQMQISYMLQHIRVAIIQAIMISAKMCTHG